MGNVCLTAPSCLVAICSMAMDKRLMKKLIKSCHLVHNSTMSKLSPPIGFVEAASLFPARLG